MKELSLSHCPQCHSEKRIKSGFRSGLQRYKCRNCGTHYTRGRKRLDREYKQFALQMYLDGSSFRQIERALEISHVTAMRWIRELGERLILRGREMMHKKHCRIVEVDELCTFISKKNTRSGCGWLLIEIEDASFPTGLAAVIART